MKRPVITILLLLTASAASGAALEDRFYAGEIPGAAALGRGGAYAAVTGDAFASFWNPAGLAGVVDNAFAVSSDFATTGSLEGIDLLNPLSGGKINFAGIAGPEVGIYWRPLSLVVEETENTENGKLIRSTRDVRISVFGLSVGIQHAEKVDFGMNINYISGTLGLAETDGVTATAAVPYGYGWGIDWGLIYRVSSSINAGLVLRNGPSAVYWDKGFGTDRLPVIIRAGLDIQLSSLMSLGIDYEKWFADSSVKSDESTHLGIEHHVADNLVLRAGLYGKNLDRGNDTAYTAGLGYRMDNYSIDLAARQFSRNGDSKDPVRRFTLSGVMPF